MLTFKLCPNSISLINDAGKLIGHVDCGDDDITVLEDGSDATLAAQVITPGIPRTFIRATPRIQALRGLLRTKDDIPFETTQPVLAALTYLYVLMHRDGDTPLTLVHHAWELHLEETDDFDYIETILDDLCVKTVHDNESLVFQGFIGGVLRVTYTVKETYRHAVETKDFTIDDVVPSFHGLFEYFRNNTQWVHDTKITQERSITINGVRLSLGIDGNALPEDPQTPPRGLFQVDRVTDANRAPEFITQFPVLAGVGLVDYLGLLYNKLVLKVNVAPYNTLEMNIRIQILQTIHAFFSEELGLGDQLEPRAGATSTIEYDQQLNAHVKADSLYELSEEGELVVRHTFAPITPEGALLTTVTVVDTNAYSETPLSVEAVFEANQSGILAALGLKGAFTLRYPVSSIACIGCGNELGKDGKLLYSFKEDQNFFKERTANSPVIMGRATYTSIGGALPNRFNIVLSSTPEDEQEGDLPDNLVFAATPEEALQLAQDWLDENITNLPATIWVIGGGKTYETFLPYLDSQVLTVVNTTRDGDSFYPWFDTKVWDKAPLGDSFYETDRFSDDDLAYSRWVFTRKLINAVGV